MYLENGNHTSKLPMSKRRNYVKNIKILKH